MSKELPTINSNRIKASLILYSRIKTSYMRRLTLTFQKIGEEVLVCGEAPNLVQTHQGGDVDVLVTVHLRMEVQVTAEVLPEKRWGGTVRRRRDTQLL